MKLLTVIATTSTLALSGSLFAQTVLIDFGRHDTGTNGRVVSNPVQPDGSTNVYWNSVGQSTQDQDGFTYTSFVDINNAAVTGWTIDTTGSGINLDGNGFNNGGLSTDAGNQDPTFANLGIFAARDATGDYWFTGAGTASFALTGLDTNSTYDFEFFGSRSGPSDRQTTYTAIGANTIASSALATTGTDIGAGDYDGNNDTIVTISGITPDASGDITIEFAITTGGFAYLNAMQVTQVPEPSSYALIAGTLALGWIMIRRRK